MEYHSVIKENTLLSFTATWMDLEGITRHRKRNTIGYHLYVESKKYNKPVNITKKEADSQIIEDKIVVASGGGQAPGVRAWVVQAIRCKVASKILL